MHAETNERKPTPQTAGRDAQREGQIMMRQSQRERTSAAIRLLKFVVKWSQRHTFYLHQEARLHSHSHIPFRARLPLFICVDSTPCPPWWSAFHVAARGGAAEGGPTASVSGAFAAVWVQLWRWDKESIKRRRFHTNYGKIMKPLVKGRMKVRLSLV